MADKREALAAWMRESVIVADGATGTVLHTRGIHPGHCLEELNLSQADLVFALHREYVHAGAQLLKSNTFKGNRFALQKFEMEGRLKDLNARGIEIARRAARGTPVWVAASLGPLRVMLKPYGDVSEDEAREACREQVAALAEAGPDLFLLETQQSVLECLFFLDACREVAPSLPVIASLTVNRDGRTFFGDSPLEGCRRLAAAGADVVGLNCSAGPADTFPFVEELAHQVDHPLAVMPNGGYPTEVNGVLTYLSSPEYVASFVKRFVDLGVNIVGGCCGTNPDTVRAIAAAVKGRTPIKRTPSGKGTLLHIEEVATAPAADEPAALRGFFAKLGKQFTVTCEIDPPKEPDARAAVEMARLLKQAGTDAVNIADNPMARVRVSSTAVAHLISQETGLTTLLHMTCRDRNLLALQSELLGASLLGVEGILALAGDPTAVGDIPAATSVNDVNVVGLVKVIASLNRGLDFSDNALGGRTAFHIGIGGNPGADDLAREVDKLKERCDAGATFVLTQPIFSLEPLERFLEAVHGLSVHVLPGLLPLAGIKQALYLHHEVPGIRLPESVLQRMESLATPADRAAYGVELARELLLGLKNLTPGAYLTAGGSKKPVLVDVLQGAV